MWPAWTGLRAWAARHRTKLIIAGILFGTGFYVYRRWQGAVARFREIEEKMSRIARTEEFYQQNQRAALNAVTLQLSLLREPVLRLVEVPSASAIRAAMQNANPTNPNDKMTIWVTVRDKTFLQVYSSLFGFTLFSLFQRVQLTMLSRELFMLSKRRSEIPPAAASRFSMAGLGGLLTRATLNGNDPLPLSEDDKRLYLEQCNYFITIGISRLVAYLEQHLKDRLAALPLQQSYSAASLRELLTSLTNQLLQDFTTPTAFLFDPSSPNQANGDASQSVGLRALFGATRAELQGPTFVSLYRDLVQQMSATMCDKLGENPLLASPQPLVKLLQPIGKLPDMLLPADAIGSKLIADALHSTPVAEEYARKLFGQFEELDASMASMFQL